MFVEDLWDYFENKRKFGGGEVLKVNVIEEGVEVIIIFVEVKGMFDLMKFCFIVVYWVYDFVEVIYFLRI